MQGGAASRVSRPQRGRERLEQRALRGDEPVGSVRERHPGRAIDLRELLHAPGPRAATPARRCCSRTRGIERRRLTAQASTRLPLFWRTSGSASRVARPGPACRSPRTIRAARLEGIVLHLVLAFDHAPRASSLRAQKTAHVGDVHLTPCAEVRERTKQACTGSGGARRQPIARGRRASPGPAQEGARRRRRIGPLAVARSTVRRPARCRSRHASHEALGGGARRVHQRAPGLLPAAVPRGPRRDTARRLGREIVAPGAALRQQLDDGALERDLVVGSGRCAARAHAEELGGAGHQNAGRGGRGACARGVGPRRAGEARRWPGPCPGDRGHHATGEGRRARGLAAILSPGSRCRSPTEGRGVLPVRATLYRRRGW